jgi:hypothetical protein
MVYAQGKGTTGAQFLKLPVGPRPAAMGSTYCALSDDVNAIWWNPAGLSLISDPQFIGMYNIWFEEIRYEYIGYAHGIEGGGAVGASLIYLHMDEIPGYDWKGEEEGGFTASDLAATISYGHPINHHISLGANLKYIHQRNEAHTAATLALDLGSLLKVGEGLRVGASLQNIRIGEKLKFIEKGDELPFNVKIGGSLRTLRDSLILNLDLNLPNDNLPSLNAGVEYWVRDVVATRLGYRSRSDLGPASHFSYGFGLRFDDYGFDAAYLPYGDLGDTYLFSFLLRFGRESQEVEEEIAEKIDDQETIDQEPFIHHDEETTFPISQKAKVSIIEESPKTIESTKEETTSHKPPAPREEGNLEIKILDLTIDEDLVELYVMVRNRGEDKAYVSPSSFTLSTERGSHKVSYKTYITKNPFHGKRLDPYRSQRGILVFETDGTPLSLLYRDGKGNLNICEIQKLTGIEQASLIH